MWFGGIKFADRQVIPVLSIFLALPCDHGSAWWRGPEGSDALLPRVLIGWIDYTDQHSVVLHKQMRGRHVGPSGRVCVGGGGEWASGESARHGGSVVPLVVA